ncbi:MAG TPA: M14 metallopeptidase family protein [Thermoanaerobaculia bacterium]
MSKLASILLFAVASLSAAAEIPTPSAFVGFEVGADKRVADYRQIREYFRALDAASPRVEVESLGKTTLGEEMILVVISSEANLARKERMKQISRRLADPRGLSAAEAETLIAEGKTIVLITCNIHSTEIAASQMAMEWAYDLATAEDEETKRRLDNVVLLLVPSLNPDGQIMETEWYRKHLGTRYEGSRMPWLYHHYVGHDNNRDWFMMTQKETRGLSRAVYHDWHPQVFVDQHQMGSSGPRMFIPPFSDPLDPDVHPLIWREVNLIGTNMAFRLEQAEKSGLIYGYSFDAYWLGGTRNTGWWKNITGLLLETASARFASPIYLHPTELRGGSKGLVDYKATVNHPNPWKGGWWRMRDIMDYQRIASDALLEIAADRRVDLLRNLVTRARSAVATAKHREAYRIPAMQHDAPTARRLAQLMADHNVEVLVAPDGDFWISLAQPYSKFVREMLEPQRYPEVRLMGATEPLPPYDVATWTLPMMLGVKVEKTLVPAALLTSPKLPPSPDMGGPARATTAELAGGAPYYAIERTSAEAVRVVNAALAGKGNVWISDAPASDLTQAPVPVELAKGTYFLDAASAKSAAVVAKDTGVAWIPVLRLPDKTLKLRSPRVGMYKPWVASMDEGWTRWLLEQYRFDLTSLDNRTIRAGNLGAKLDAIILPDLDKNVIATGKSKREEGQTNYSAPFPSEYQGGLDKEGAKALRDFVEAGGTLIAFDSSSEYVLDEFNVPVRNALARARREEFNVPGSLLRAEIAKDHPVTAGMPDEVALFLDDPIAFETSPPGAEMSQWVLVSYPEHADTMLLSGWIRGQERLSRRAAAVAMTYGKGKIVLFGFRPQHRAQTHATFPLLFNALYWSTQ